MPGRHGATLSPKQLRRDARTDAELGLKLDPELAAAIEQERPKTRADCEGGPRPCPFVSCRHHLYLDVTAVGSIHLNFPDKEVWELERSCSLDLAEEDGLTLDEVGKALQVTRERARQIEAKALRRVQGAGVG